MDTCIVFFNSGEEKRFKDIADWTIKESHVELKVYKQKKGKLDTICIPFQNVLTYEFVTEEN